MGTALHIDAIELAAGRNCVGSNFLGVTRGPVADDFDDFELAARLGKRLVEAFVTRAASTGWPAGPRT